MSNFVLIAAGFDASMLTLGTLTMSTAGKTSVVVNLSTGVLGNDISTATSSKFFHLHDFTTTAAFIDLYGEGLANLLPTWSTVCYARALRTALRAGATANSWTSPSNINVSISSTTGKVTVSYSSAVFGLTWSAKAGRDLLGFSANQSGATSYLGDQVPMYLIVSGMEAVSSPTPFYEAEEVGNHTAPDDGISEGFGISRERGLIYCDFTMQYETKQKTERLAALSTHPFTHQHLKQHCRGQYPFMVTYGWPPANVLSGSSIVSADTYVFMNRTEGLRHEPERASDSNDAQFHTRYRGRAIAAYYHS